MKLLQPIVLSAALVSLNAHAGFFDFLKSSEDDAPKAETYTQAAAEKAPQENAVADMASNGIDLAGALVPQLTSALSISEEQATGGLGSIMQYAKSSLSNPEEKQLESTVPGLESIIAAAPVLTGSKGGLSSALGQIGALGGSVGDAAKAAGGISLVKQQFEALGLSSEMIGKIAQMAMQYFSANDAATSNLLDQALGALTK